jgi:hypothetical protein
MSWFRPNTHPHEIHHTERGEKEVFGNLGIIFAIMAIGLLTITTIN